MSDLNNCSFTGRLTRDSLFKGISTGLCEFSIAINGIKPEEVIFMKVNLWGKSAETMKNYLVKGKQVAVTGNLKKNEWKDKDGGEHKDFVLNCFTVILLGGATESSKPAWEDHKYDDQDIPF